jgi:hypothetical protein
VEGRKPVNGLGEVPSRFKCNASGCKKSFSCLDFLQSYTVWAEEKRKKRAPPSPDRVTNMLPEKEKRTKMNPPAEISDEAFDLFTQPDNAAPPTNMKSSMTTAPLVPAAPLIPSAPLVSAAPMVPATLPRDLADALRHLTASSIRLTEQLSDLSNTTSDLMDELKAHRKTITSLESRLTRLESAPSSTNVTPTGTPSRRSLTPINIPVVIPTNSENLVPGGNPHNSSNLSFARAVAASQSEARSKGFEALKCLHKRNDPNSRPPPSTETAAVYVTGFQWQKLRSIRDALYQARFQFRRIHRTSWIGRTIVEFILSADYKTQFCNEITAAGYNVITLDPTTNPRATNAETALYAKKSFCVRAVKTVLNTSSEMVKKHFTTLVKNGDATLQQIYEEEMNLALETRAADIRALTSRLDSVDLSATERAELLTEITRLDPSYTHVPTDPDTIMVVTNDGDDCN